MKFLNIGPLELVFILILALVLLGPERMIASARSLGKWIYQLVRSPFWTSVMDTSREIRDLPTKIVREAGLEESIKEIKQLNRDVGKEAGLDEMDQATREMNQRIREAANLANQEFLKNRTISPEEIKPEEQSESKYQAGEKTLPEEDPPDII